MIITVAGTGAVAPSYSKKSQPIHATTSSPNTDEPNVVSNDNSAGASEHHDEDVSDVNMDLDHAADDAHFDEPAIPNIWSIDAGHEDDANSDSIHHDMGAQDSNDELEKPSFLRRLKKRRESKDKE